MLPLLLLKCIWVEIKSREFSFFKISLSSRLHVEDIKQDDSTRYNDMNEKAKDFIFYNKYMPSAGLHCPLHMVCALSLALILP